MMQLRRKIPRMGRRLGGEGRGVALSGKGKMEGVEEWGLGEYAHPRVMVGAQRLGGGVQICIRQLKGYPKTERQTKRKQDIQTYRRTE